MSSPNPKELNMRMPSGNELEANPQWLPGGKFENGVFTDDGLFVAPKDLPFEERALHESVKTTKTDCCYKQYEVIKDIPNVNEGKAIPWFDQKGGGIQYELPKGWHIDYLLRKGYIKILQ